MLFSTVNSVFSKTSGATECREHYSSNHQLRTLASKIFLNVLSIKTQGFSSSSNDTNGTEIMQQCPEIFHKRLHQMLSQMLSTHKHWQSFTAPNVSKVLQRPQQHHCNKTSQRRRVNKIIKRQWDLKKQSINEASPETGWSTHILKAQLNLLKVIFYCATIQSLKQKHSKAWLQE